MQKASKFFHSYFFKKNRATCRSAIVKNDKKKLLRYIKADDLYLCLKLDEHGNTALLLAIQNESPSILRLLLKHHAHPDQPNCLTLQTPLSYLASTTYLEETYDQTQLTIEMASMLLEHGAYVDKCSTHVIRDYLGNEAVVLETPLMSAARVGNLAMATLLVEKNANLNYTEKNSGLRPIHYAISNGDLAMFDLLENAGASCRSVIGSNEDTLLHYFCSYATNDRHMALLKRLISIGCDINAVNNHRQTPLMFAARLDMINTCHYLLDLGARVDLVDVHGERASDYAEKYSQCWTLLDRALNGVDRRRRSRSITKEFSIRRSSTTLSQANLYQGVSHQSREDLFGMNMHRFSYVRSDDQFAGDEPDMKFTRMLEELQEKEARSNGRCP